MVMNLKLKTRMLMGYAIPIVIYLGFASTVYVAADRIDQAFDEVERVGKVAQSSSDMALSLEGMIRDARGYLINADPKFLDRYEVEKRDFQRAFSATQMLVMHPEQKQRLLQLEVLAQDYQQFAQEFITLRKQNKQAEALKLFAQDRGAKIVDDFTRLYQEFDNAEQQLLEQRSQQAQDNLHLVLKVLILGSVLILGLAVIVALLISSGITRMIQQSVQAIASSSAEIAATVEQHERTAVQQSASVTETTTTMDELSTSSRQSADQAEVAAQRAQKILALVDRNRSTDQNGYSSSLREKVEQIAQQILQLSEQTNQIRTISTLVSDLASQTNMLALNAAVEAVRAGEHGKGFSVVATEIRKLADQSRKSAERISNLVTEIQTATTSTVLVTDEGTKTVASIVAEISDIALNNQQISLTAKQQAIAVQQVLEAMSMLNRGAAETAAGITQTKVGTQKLNEAALNLKSLI